jgi:hypothetical protein
MTTLLLQQISESDDSEPDYLDELDKQEAALDEQLAAMSAEEDEEGDEEDEEWDEEDELLHPDQAIIEKLYKKGKVQRFLNDHEQARLDFLLQRWGLKAREILRSLDDVHDQPSWKLPYKFNAWYTGTNKPVLSFPFSLDRQWFEIVMAKRRQILEDNRSRFTYGMLTHKLGQAQLLVLLPRISRKMLQSHKIIMLCLQQVLTQHSQGYMTQRQRLLRRSTRPACKQRLPHQFSIQRSKRRMARLRRCG